MRGFWFMIEAVIAGVIMVSFVAFLVSSNFSQAEQDLTPEGYRILSGLDRQGLLRIYAHTGDYQAIDDEVQLHSYNHTVQICSDAECMGSRPSARNAWVASYILSGSGEYNPKEVRLYIYEQ